jgi:hypothetical protein
MVQHLHCQLHSEHQSPGYRGHESLEPGHSYRHHHPPGSLGGRMTACELEQIGWC